MNDEYAELSMANRVSATTVAAVPSLSPRAWLMYSAKSSPQLCPGSWIERASTNKAAPTSTKISTREPTIRPTSACHGFGRAVDPASVTTRSSAAAPDQTMRRAAYRCDPPAPEQQARGTVPPTVKRVL